MWRSAALMKLIRNWGTPVDLPAEAAKQLGDHRRLPNLSVGSFLKALLPTPCRWFTSAGTAMQSTWTWAWHPSLSPPTEKRSPRQSFHVLP